MWPYLCKPCSVTAVICEVVTFAPDNPQDMEPRKNKRNQFASAAHLFERIFKKCNFNEFDNLTPLMMAVPRIHMREGFELDGYNAGDSKNAEMKLYASKIGSTDRYLPVSAEDMKHFNGKVIWRKMEGLFPNGKNVETRPAIKAFREGQFIHNTIPHEASKTVPPVLNYLEFPFTPGAIWEAVLLTEASRLYLQHLWHGCYNNGMLVVDNTSLNLACSPFKVEYKFLIDDDRIPPSVELLSDSEALVRYCFWNEWGGLRRVGLKLIRKKRGAVKEDLGTETILEYHSGNRY